MTSSGRQVLVNLAQLSSDYELAHLSRFLPELAATRSADRFVAVVPSRYAAVVQGWGMTPAGQPTALRVLRSRLPLEPVARLSTGRRPDVILNPLSHIPVRSRVPQLVWACHLPSVRDAGGGPETSGLGVWRATMPKSAFVVYPTAAARRVAEMPAFRAPGLILRPPLRETPPRMDQRLAHDGSARLRVLVPANDHPGRNLTLLPRVSRVLTERGVDHHIRVAGQVPSDCTSSHVSADFAYDRENLWELRGRFDVVVLPSLGQSCCSSLVEFERLGFAVAASDVEAHVEMRDRARLFDPASARAAAEAILQAAQDGHHEFADEEDWRHTTPQTYASAVSAEIDRLVEAGGLPWAV